MNLKVENIENTNNVMRFTLSDVNVSLANAIRRTLLSDIPIVVFKTSPYEENKATIMSNTSRLNNEVIKQRLSCIPIHITDLDTPLQNYIMEVDEVNDSDTITYVTTEHFKIKNIETGKYLNEQQTRSMFPPNQHTGHYIDFVRLRPKISDELPGEKLNMKCEFSIGTCKEDGMFNAVSTCAYGYTQDLALVEIELAKKLQIWRDAGLKQEEIEFEKKNWLMLDALRLTIPDSFNFIIESIGIFTNEMLIVKACNILIKRLHDLNDIIETDELSIELSQNTMVNCYDITLENEDYTIGKIIEFMLYSTYFQVKLSAKEQYNVMGLKKNAKESEIKEVYKKTQMNLNAVMTYCGFKKFHPHDSHSIIRVAYKELTNQSIIKGQLKHCIVKSIKIYEKIKTYFEK